MAEEEFINAIVEAHNRRRRLHGVPELAHSSELGKTAQHWAERVAAQAHIAYSEMSGIGENITFFPRDMDPDRIVEHWYEEHEKYEYETPGWQTGTNYFTQIIWKSTEEIGVGRAFVDGDPSEESPEQTELRKCGKIAEPGDQVVAVFYRPSGNNNRAGHFAINVLKPIPEKINGTNGNS